MIKTHEKKEFIKWVLAKHQLKRREAVWILNYMISHEDLLKNIHFVDEGIEYCPRGLIISSVGSKHLPFRFYINKNMTEDAERTFHDIRFNKESPTYIHLRFPDSHKSPEYLNIIEENPYYQEEETYEYSELATKFLDECLFKVQIDKALDNRNEELFNELVGKVNV
ncbi:ReoY family proteolytic degradation factor [Aquibacillus saliphilus]|uniref:ReoY family proteolytic degradation factor n=1 Tax=Aquibacillus saliphilus TaxID=1909422 RepID=UPI001CEFFE75|nr:ReoY family proteolytic degradation factor [Aquibacillus saliphilus]